MANDRPCEGHAPTARGRLAAGSPSLVSRWPAGVRSGSAVGSPQEFPAGLWKPTDWGVFMCPLVLSIAQGCTSDQLCVNYRAVFELYLYLNWENSKYFGWAQIT
ncbi:predicted protein [Coccidioides posadasii str. Silveira]|uniref:Predicted protein n=2 Tax=Coccidioides posadasii TaxID=199306 RepID=E9DD07_COCPS|nr:predicted protein [Coccidioides posadasii str. Silveira]KMM65779.1 hypothetical protein CPAG_02121 [Coccidioides posadasii RMSCC 3488]